MNLFYQNCHDAIRDGNAAAPKCIGYEARGWFLYDPHAGCPAGATPELFCVRSGHLPVPLSREGTVIFNQFLKGTNK